MLEPLWHGGCMILSAKQKMWILLFAGVGVPWLIAVACVALDGGMWVVWALVAYAVPWTVWMWFEGLLRWRVDDDGRVVPAVVHKQQWHDFVDWMQSWWDREAVPVKSQVRGDPYEGILEHVAHLIPERKEKKYKKPGFFYVADPKGKEWGKDPVTGEFIRVKRVYVRVHGKHYGHNDTFNDFEA